MEERFSDAHLQTWARDGAVLIPDFFTNQEIADIQRDIELVYPRPWRPKIPNFFSRMVTRKGKRFAFGDFGQDQLLYLIDFPFNCSEKLNLIGLHPSLLAFSKEALQTNRVQAYQMSLWAKYSNYANYEQPFHCDYTNHTLAVPSDDLRLSAVNFMIYLSDVTDAHGAIHFVPLPESEQIVPDLCIIPDADAQLSLKERERSGSGGAGSVFAYRIDVYHRGTNLTAPRGRRFTLSASFKAAGNEAIGYSAWPSTVARPWKVVFDHATPEQLACLGVPLPGDPFWTERTVAAAQARWPGWDMSAYRAGVDAKTDLART